MAEREKLIEIKDLQITFGSGKRKFYRDHGGIWFRKVNFTEYDCYD